MKIDTKTTVAGVAVVVAAGAGFIGGMQYQKTKAVANFRGNFTQGQMTTANGQTRTTGNRPSGSGSAQGMRGGMVTGEVTAKDDKSLTVKLTDGSSKIVILSGSTTYALSSEASLDKIAVGTTISAFGTSNSDGSTTATSVEINPVQRGQVTPPQGQ